MLSPAFILIYGSDAQLLQTRRWVLERAGHRVWVTVELADIARINPPEPIDLIMLCHSLTMELCGRAIAIVSTRWPHAQTVVLIAGQRGCLPATTAKIIDATRGPVALLDSVARLVSSPVALSSHV